MRPGALVWLCLPGALVIGFYLVVVGSFAEVSFLTLEPGGVAMSGPPTLANYRAAIASEHARYVAGFTFRLSTEITLLCIVLGYPLAYVMARSPSRLTRRAILFCLVAVFLSGGVTRAYAWMVILGNQGLVNWALASVGLAPVRMMNNETAVVFSVLHFILPFFVLTLFSAIRTIPESLENAARNLGASRLGAFLNVTLPLSAPGVVAAAALAFALSLGAFLFPQLLGGGRVHVIATLIFDRIAASYNIPAAAASAVLFLFLALGILLVFGVAQRVAVTRYGAAGRST